MKVYEARRDDESRRVQHFCPFRHAVASLQQPGDTAIFNQQVMAAIEPLRRVD